MLSSTDLQSEYLFNVERIKTNLGADNIVKFLRGNYLLLKVGIYLYNAAYNSNCRNILIS